MHRENMGTIQTNVTGDTSEELTLVQAAKADDITAFEQLINKDDSGAAHGLPHCVRPAGCGRSEHGRDCGNAGVERSSSEIKIASREVAVARAVESVLQEKTKRRRTTAVKCSKFLTELNDFLD